MSRYTPKRLVVLLSALTITLLLVLILGTVALADSPILHKVSAGGPDACEADGLRPGCDGNFALTAIEYADGSIIGQYSDQFGGGYGGFHAVIDCLSVAGNEAWVSGMITQGVVHDLASGVDYDLVGLPVATRVRDNGTSANDPADEISYSWIGEGVAISCTEQPDYELGIMPQGQVKVK